MPWFRYLKQEIPAVSPDDNGAATFTSVSWHPEDALRLITTTAGHRFFINYSAHIDCQVLGQLHDLHLVWDTCASTRAPPDDAATVAVVDGGLYFTNPVKLRTDLKASINSDDPIPYSERTTSYVFLQNLPAAETSTTTRSSFIYAQCRCNLTSVPRWTC